MSKDNCKEVDLTEFKGLSLDDVQAIIQKEFPKGLHPERHPTRPAFIGFNVCRYYYVDKRPAVLHAVRDILTPGNQPLSYGCPVANRADKRCDPETGESYWEVTTG
jgi:hypothetical protein